MIMEAFRPVSGGLGSATHNSSPSKRTFDVAFLTGARDSPDPPHVVNALPPSKVSKVSSIGPSSPKEASPRSRTPPGGGRLSPPSTKTFSPPRDSAIPGSAFTKVMRSTAPPSPPLTATASSSPDLMASLASSWTSVAPTSSASSFSTMASMLRGGKSLMPLLANSSILAPGLTPLLPHVSAHESLNNNLVEEYIKSQQQLFASKADLSPSETLSRLRSSMYPPDPYKLPFSPLGYPLTTPPSGDHSKLAVAASFLPPPSVSALISPSLSSFSQNVCAKCNISFRMTSDLVYHMRSQHKKEQDPNKKRRDEKLKCPICGENFRERHHLTRHMTAHQDRAEEVDKC
ncbi:uncharacterized protein LOC143032582 [Oratosquilla oratoria]|uniref:uncharacterized protein LOC143032582 n=1 Tax=Oratosquilla oratoria TaxID=337810 RepID=UPI003F7696D3